MATPKLKVLGTDQGITITKPWNDEMYKHNDKVADIQKNKIRDAVEKAYANGQLSVLNTIHKAVSGYGVMGMDIHEMHREALLQISLVQNYWLKDQAWNDLVKAKIVTPLDYYVDGVIDYVGY